MGLAFAKILAPQVAQLPSRARGLALDLEIRRLSKLDERSVLIEIARRDNNADIPLDKPDQAVEYGLATVHRMLPWARGLICPHRDKLLNMVDSPEVVIIRSVVTWLTPDPTQKLIPAFATYVVKRGILSLCGASLGSV
jgi:hypothetical protein